MQALVNYIMRGRMSAMLVVTVFGLLSLLLPPVGYLSGGALALVTLRHGATEGGIVMAGALLIGAMFSAVLLGSPVVALLMGAVSWLPVWALSQALRSTVSLAKTLQMTVLLGGLAVVVMHVVLGDTTIWWREVLDTIFQPVVEAGVSVEGGSWEESINQMSRLMTGLVAAALMMSTLVSLLLGRWWQSQLFNPGGFREEFHGLRLDKRLAVVLFVCVGLAMADLAQWISDLLPVLLLPFLLSGLAVVHSTVSRLKANMAWLVVMYALLLVAMPQVGSMIALLGVVDAWINVRALIKDKDDSSAGGVDN